MFSNFGHSDEFFIMPVCYHPTTVLLVDDDVHFAENLALNLDNKLSILTFNDPTAAINYVQNGPHHLLFNTRCLENNRSLNFPAIRNEIYNTNRFKVMLINIIDYDMPQKNGIEMIHTMKFPPEIEYNTYIMLTGIIKSQLDDRIKGSKIANSLISKGDPGYVDKLLEMIKEKSELIFQWCAYPIVQNFATDPVENATLLFDKHLAPILEKHILEHQICEFYLYDRQGGYLLLDKDANLSWLFIRSEWGIENTIKLAMAHHAPASVIQALKNREVILSLYEKEDLDRLNKINWDDYLLPATEYVGDNYYLTRFGIPATVKYYFAYTNELPQNAIDRKRILSYQTFLDEN